VKTLYRRGRIRSAAHPSATAMLVDGERIAWIGAEDDAPAADTTVDLAGGWLAPAFVDAHVHATSTGLALSGLDLSRTTSLDDALGRVRRTAAALPAGAVVLGTGWDETRWPEGRPPTARELSNASGHRPVYLSRVDVHSAVVSEELLARAAVPHDDGLVRQDAHHQLRKLAFESVTPAQREVAQRATLDRAASLGIAAVHECGGPEIAGEEDFRALLSLDGPRPEVVGYWAELGAVEKARELGARGAAGDLFADGSIGSRTAALNSPYADDDPHFSHSGEPYVTEQEVADHVIACTRANLQAGFHCIGDAAIHRVVAGFTAAAELLGDDALRQARHRLEHVELVGKREIAVLARLGVVASVQPAFDAAWGGRHGMYAERLGAWRAAKLNPFAEMAHAGVELAFGSDAPVTPLDPWGAVGAAVQHRTGHHAITVEQAFTAHTVGGWRAAGDDASGVLVAGSPATFAVWDGEYGADTPAPTCRLTVLRGEPIFRSEDA
jgi:predicted amidohydrolase YtcJ